MAIWAIYQIDFIQILNVFIETWRAFHCGIFPKYIFPGEWFAMNKILVLCYDSYNLILKLAIS